MDVGISNNIYDANLVVKIHLETFKGFFLTFLGEGFLKILYQGFIEHEESNLIIAKDENEVIGFLAYSNNMSMFYRFLIKKHLLGFSWYATLAFFRNPKIFFRLLSAFGKSKEVKRGEAYIELASIGVNPKYKGKGIGSLLIKHLQNSADLKKYEYISLDTDAENNEYANTFYKKSGFVLARSFETEQGRKMNEFRWKL